MTDVLLYLAGVLLFVIGLAASVGLHELGHLIPGKLFNVKVTQYFVGFGRTLWSRRYGETEYGVKAIPLGGYVKLVGMLPPDKSDPERVRSRPTGMLAQLVDDARSAEYEFVGEHDHDRLFHSQAWWKRIIIMGSGVTINLVLAFLLIAVVFVGYGEQEPTLTIATVNQCVKVVPAGHDAGRCTTRDPESPAKLAGLLPGDRVLSFNGTAITSYPQLQQTVRANNAGAATIVVVRNGHQLTLHTDTRIDRLPNLDGSGFVHAGFLGITPTVEVQRQSLGTVFSTMASGTWDTLVTLGHFPQKLYHVARASVGLEKRSADSPMSVVGAGRVAGEIATNSQTTLAQRFFTVILLLGNLNLFLGLINLVPLPPFDGAGIATTIYEVIRRGIARMLGRPDPGAVDSAKLLPVTYAMALLILLMSVVLIYADIVAPVPLS